MATQYSVTIVDRNNCVQTAADPFVYLECRYIPANLTVTQGNTVIWFNYGNVTHSVTSNQTLDGGLPGFDSGPIFRGGIFQYTFTQTGTFHYYDSGFTFMKGIVTVTLLRHLRPRRL